MNIWQNFQITDNRCYLHQVGPLKIWIRRQNDEWMVASINDAGQTEETHASVVENIPEGLEWYRYVLSGSCKTVELTPVTPDRSVIVRPESILKIESGARALFFVLIPVWIKIVIGTRRKHPLDELPCKVLSNTWFGEPHEGELCYYLKTWAKRSLDGLTPRPHQMVCPVEIKNGSSSDLVFKRLCIRTGFLSIYQGASWLWTNKVFVQFRGVNQTSKIKYDNDIPDFEPDCRLIGLPRQKPVRDFSIKSFDNFKVVLSG
jgi:hypothetical protein